MFGVNDLSQIEIIRRENRVVCVFLATGLDVSALEWLVAVWDDVHKLSGFRWHLIAPTITPLDNDLRLANKHKYDTSFALELTSLYGLSRNDLPCIVLDTFNEEERQLRIALPTTERDKRQLIETIANYISSRVKIPYANMSDAQVRSLTEDLYNHIQGKAALRSLVGWLPNAASIIMKTTLGRPD